MIFKMRLPGIEPSNDREPRHGSQEASNLRQRSLQLQAQIAETLGLPVTAFHQADTIRPSGPDALESTQGEAFAMSRDCSALFAAFTSIADPQERQRLLQIVRDAAGRPAKVPVKT
jgi:hypothetical protein